MTRILTLLLLISAPPLAAHQGAHPLTRLILVEATPAETLVTVQVPAVLAYAQAAAERPTRMSPIVAPFLTTSFGQFGAVYTVDADGVLREPATVAGLVDAVAPLRGAQPQIVSSRAMSIGQTGEMHVTDVVIELVLRFPPGTDLALHKIAHPPVLPPAWYLETLVHDTRHAAPVSLDRIGALDAPLLLPAP